MALGMHTQAAYLKTEWAREGLVRTNLYLYQNTPPMQTRWGGVRYLTAFELGRHMSKTQKFEVTRESSSGANVGSTEHTSEIAARRYALTLRRNIRSEGSTDRVKLEKVTMTRMRLPLGR